MTKRSIQQHIDDDRNKLDDSTLSPQMRRHVENELEHLEKYQAKHPEQDRDPTAFEMYCDENPDAAECKIYED